MYLPAVVEDWWASFRDETSTEMDFSTSETLLRCALRGRERRGGRGGEGEGEEEGEGKGEGEGGRVRMGRRSPHTKVCLRVLNFTP